MELTIHELKQSIEVNSETKDYIDLALKDVKPQMKDEVLKFLAISKVKPNDPLFKLMLACHYFNLITLNAPNEIQNAFEVGTVNLLTKLGDTLDGLKATSVKQVEAEISKSVNRLLEQQDKTTPSRKWLKRCGLGAGSLFLFGLGAFTSYQYAQMQYASTLEIENRQLLTWAKSPEGRFAKNLMTWNPGLFNGRCEQSVANLGIGYGEIIRKDGENVGIREIKQGYCVVFRQRPPF